MSRVIAVANQKGGVSKITTTVNLGIGLVRKGYRVLVIDLLPCNIELSGMEVSIINAMSRELILKQYVDQMREYYDYILIDCMPSLGMLTINAFVASDSVLIPVQAAYLPVRGLEQLIMKISRVKRHINPAICFEGILISMVDSRTVYAREIIELVRENYGEALRIFDTMIPFSVRAAETSAAGVSIYNLYPGHKVAQAYEELTNEVIAFEKRGGDAHE